MEPKKLALIRILQILMENTDINHPITHEQIADKLYNDYNIEIERKAIGRHISELKDMFEKDSMNKKNGDYTVIFSERRRGTYIEKRVFEDAELHMLIDGVLSSKYITAKHSKDLIVKLCSLSNKYFKSHVKNIYSVNEWNKTDNFDLFYNIELIDEAIENNKQIKFVFNRYWTDKKLHKSVTHIVSPYSLILHNQRYYLLSYDEQHNKMANYRLDRITNMEIVENSISKPLKSIPGYENGIDYKDLATSRPYMYSDKAETIVFTTHFKQVDSLVDWFGTNFEIENIPDSQNVKITLKASPQAMKYWALQYADVVKIIEPLSLKESLKTTLKQALDKYND